MSNKPSPEKTDRPQQGESPTKTKKAPQKRGNPLTRGRSSHVGLYPHNIHPGLVPGIGVDEQRHVFSIDKLVFGITAVLIVAFVAWGVMSPESVGEVSSVAFAWTMKNMGWLLNITVMVSIGAMLFIAFSRYGRIRLGKDGEKPEFSRFAWVAMMFGAGIGVGIFFFGASEPLYYFVSPPPLTGVEPETPGAIHMAVAQSSYHWGISAWAMYALVGGAMAYSSYRRGRVTLISSVFRSLFGKQTDGFAGRLVDMFAIIATLFGTAASLGLAAIQLGKGVEIVSGASRVTNNGLIIILAVLTAAFIISAVSGVSRGIRYLSTTNIVLTLSLVLFVFFAGPTLFLLNLLPSGVTEYANEFLSMMGKSLSWGSDVVEFQSAWTAFYFAWWVAWTPFVGAFIARISRGRTLREFCLVVIAIPTAILIFAFTIFGGAAMWMKRQGIEGISADDSPQTILFHLFDKLPLANVTPFLIMVALAIFFVTSADSASVIMGTFSSRGNPAPNKLVVIFWGLAMMGIATVMLLSGGESSLTGLQNLTILIAIPFCIILLLMIVAFIMDLRTDPASIRSDYESTMLSNAVVRGIEKYGDDFELTVRHSGDGRGAGADFDSTSEKVTEWYQRHDETGAEVGYDYETETWDDGYEPETPGPITEPKVGEIGAGDKKPAADAEAGKDVDPTKDATSKDVASKD
ncbi:BCCT family transporter [Pseudoglutamicibacter cumminsii]|uniref:BCCT family transporter n=1 Tax=Pseudoglutamicibacter cumminsii TaxID=156979 RepID=A0AAP4C8A0_9MICC|nr:BCCT family transporter [Pseudoglutamicibacter cumminsii]MDK6275717.1 BCCT family transporter [Pseudoglutamicibacter cumminsii]